MKSLKEIATLVNGRAVKVFDYNVSKDKQFIAVETEVAPSPEAMKVIYDNDMRVSYDLYASAEKGRYCMYVINHKEIKNYEWE